MGKSRTHIPLYKSPKYPETYGDLIDWIAARMERPQEKVCFRMSDRGDPITYADFQKAIHKISNFLHDLGVVKGDKIAIFLNNCVEYAYLYHAISKCAAVIVPINPFLKAEPLFYILNQCDAKYLITSRGLFSDKIERNIYKLKNISSTMFIDGFFDDNRFKAIDFSQYDRYPSEFSPKHRSTGDDIQGIWYTSGTTGPPKGAVIKNKTYVYRLIYFSKHLVVTSADVSYFALPMYHAAHVMVGKMAMFAGGETVQVKWFSASNFWKEIVKYNATMTFTTGTIIPILLKSPVTDDEIKGRRQLRMWFGWPVDDPPSVQSRWPNIVFIESYGTTEAPGATMSDPKNPELGNAGNILPFTNLKIVDPETKKELSKNTVGEIVIGHKLGSGYIVKEYYKDPEKSKEVIKDGFWYSGDLGMVNEKDQLIFIDRIKDYLRVGGENVSSSVVEEVIRKHPAVAEVAIVGKKGDLGHDEIVAYVVPRQGASIDPTEFFLFCNHNMAYFMVPKYLVIRDELPKTGTQKVEKYKLKENIPGDAINRDSLGILLKR